MMEALRLLRNVTVPGGFVLLAAVLAVRTGLTAAWPPMVKQALPYAIVAVGVVLGWRFNRSRLIFALLVIFLVERAISLGAGGPGGGITIVRSAAVLMPLNLMALAAAPERGVALGRGLGWGMVLLLQPLLLLAGLWWRPELIHGALVHRFVELPIAALPLPQPGLLAFALAFLVLLAMAARRRGAMEQGLLWVLPAVFLALTAAHLPAAMIYFAAAGIILIVAVIEAAYGMAYRDELTGLPGRRALNEALLKVGSRYAVAMLDIDFFKKFNDRYGHDVGDQVLRMVASRIGRVGGGGRAFRYGGEEFSILFRGREVEDVLPHLESLRESVANSGFSLRGRNRPRRRPKNPAARGGGGRRVSVTISIGVAACNGKRGRPEEVVKAADQALYRAKKGGRNRVAT